jgi:hypothetical protein
MLWGTGGGEWLGRGTGVMKAMVISTQGRLPVFLSSLMAGNEQFP